MLSHRSTTKLLAAVALAALVLTPGCKPDKTNDGGVDVKKADGTAKSVLTYARTTDYKSLDPPKQFDSVSMEIITNVYDTLLQYSYLKRPYQLEPNLLAKMPELADDKVTYTFTLRKGIKFHDDECFPGGKGRELKSDDVLYSLKRFSDATINTRSYDVLLKDRIVGLDALREKTKTNKAMDFGKEVVEGLTKVDDYTFTMKLMKPDPLALMPFASGALGIVPHEAVTKYGKEFERHPVGTGPFYMAENPRRGVIVMRKNVNYHMTYPTEGEPGDKEKGLLADAGKKLPLVDEVRRPLIEESQPQMLKFKSGELDWVGIDKDNFTQMVDRKDSTFTLKPDLASRYNIYTEPSLATSYIVINQKDPLLGKNKALRQALILALDRKGFIDKMQNGRGFPLATIVPLPISGNEKELKFEYYDTNLELAKAKLVEAGFPNGEGLPEITIEFRASTTTARQQFEFMRSQYAKIGITLKGSFQTFSAFLQKVEAANFQLADSGWQADYPDPENFYQLLYGPNHAPGPNSSSYANPEYDKLYEQMRGMAPSPERNEVIRKMAEILKEDVPVMLNMTAISVGLTQKWLGNMKRNLMDDAHFKYLSIDAAAKSKGLPK